MHSRLLSFGLLLVLLPFRTLAGDEIALVGLAQIGGVKLAYVRLEMAGVTLNLVENETTAGVRLLDANAREGWARVQQRGEEFVLRLVGGSSRVDAKTTESGQIGSVDYIGALREYTRSLPVAEREPSQAELLRFHATGATHIARAVDSAEPGRAAAAEGGSGKNSPDSEPSRQLGVLLSALAPGCRQGTADEIAHLRRLRILQNDPAVRARLLSELRAYAAPGD